MQEIIKEFPEGSAIVLDGEFGTKVHYINEDLEVRTYLIQNEWFAPNFLLDDVGPRMVHILKNDLRGRFPNAQEFRVYKRFGEVVFLCSVEAPHE